MAERSHFRDSVKLISSFKTSGTVTPSSRFLIDRMLDPIDFANANCLVELGPGNGCVTRRLLERMSTSAKLICFEVNPEFYAKLCEIKDPRLCVLNRCASSIRQALDEFEMTEADHIVSSIPLALLDGITREKILSSVDANLRAGGGYTQYQYSLKNYGEIKRVFKDVKLGFTLRNIPPAFVYECNKREAVR